MLLLLLLLLFCRYFNYIRTAGGSTPHKTMRECLEIARGRQTSTVLSHSANNGSRGRMKGQTFDEASLDLPLYSSREGGSKKEDLPAKLAAKVEAYNPMASIW